MKKWIISVIAVLLLVSTFAHEYILLAYKFNLRMGDELEMHLFVADGFNIQQERPMQNAITKKFDLLTVNGVTNLLDSTVAEALPVIKRKVDFEGLGLICMERRYAKISLPTSRFLAYLAEDHIENITVPKDKNNKLQRERYTRYIKSLVQSNPIKGDSIYKTNCNQAFEIILLKNPYLLHKGEVLTAQILFMGKPLAGKLITARNRNGSNAATAQTAKTNKAGICAFKVTGKGDWFIHCTHMIPCEGKKEADWESFWTSFSFGVN